MRRVTAIVAAIAMVVAMTPIGVGASTPAAASGIVRGTVIENSGRPLGTRLQAQLVDSKGIAVPGMVTAVERDGAFAFTNVTPGLYTVQILGAKGMSAVNVTAGRVAVASVTVSVARAGAPAPRLTKAQLGWLWGGIIAGGSLGGWAIYEATKDDASGSQ